MNVLKFVGVALTIAIVTGISIHQFNHVSRASLLASDAARSSPIATKTDTAVGETSPGSATQRYRLDASQSKFIAHAMAGGLLWFKGHDHLVAVRDFTGEAQFTTESITASSLQITANAGSM